MRRQIFSFLFCSTALLGLASCSAGGGNQTSEPSTPPGNGQVADLVDVEDIRVEVGGGDFSEAALAALAALAGSADEVVDEGGGGGEAGVEAVADGAGGDG